MAEETQAAMSKLRPVERVVHLSAIHLQNEPRQQEAPLLLGSADQQEDVGHDCDEAAEDSTGQDGDDVR